MNRVTYTEVAGEILISSTTQRKTRVETANRILDVQTDCSRRCDHTTCWIQTSHVCRGNKGESDISVYRHARIRSNLIYSVLASSMIVHTYSSSRRIKYSHDSSAVQRSTQYDSYYVLSSSSLTQAHDSRFFHSYLRPPEVDTQM